MARQKLTSNNKIEGETLTPVEWNEAVNAINYNIDSVTALSSSTSKNAADIDAVKNTAENALSLAQGMQGALAYDDYLAMITALEQMGVGDLNVGQQILIVKDVPNVWISANDGNGEEYTYTTDAAVETALKSNAGLVGSWYVLRPLDTNKVDVSGKQDKLKCYTETDKYAQIKAETNVYIGVSAYPDAIIIDGDGTVNYNGNEIATKDDLSNIETNVELTEAVAANTKAISTAQSTADKAQETANNALNIANEASTQLKANVTEQKKLNDGGSGNWFAIKPTTLVENTQDSSGRYVDDTAIGEDENIETAGYTFMSKLIDLKLGQTITVTSGLGQNLRFYAAKENSKEINQQTYITYLGSGNSYKATRNYRVSYCAVPANGFETDAATAIQNSRYAIRTETLADRVSELEAEITALKEQINNAGGGNGYSIIEDDDQNPITV